MDSVSGPSPMKLEYEQYVAHFRLVVGKYWPIIFARRRQKSCRYRPLVKIRESEEIKRAFATVFHYHRKRTWSEPVEIKRRCKCPAVRFLKVTPSGCSVNHVLRNVAWRLTDSARDMQKLVVTIPKSRDTNYILGAIYILHNGAGVGRWDEDSLYEGAVEGVNYIFSRVSIQQQAEQRNHDHFAEKFCQVTRFEHFVIVNYVGHAVMVMRK